MSATRQPYGSIPSAPYAGGAEGNADARSAQHRPASEEGDEWEAALTRARRQTYEGAEPQASGAWPDHSQGSMAAAVPSAISPGPGHALRVHDQPAWSAPPVKPKSSLGAIVVTGLVVGALSTGAWLWQQQEHTRLMRAKDQQLERLEAQKSAAQDARNELEKTLAAERLQHTGALESLRAERNAALNAAAPNTGLAAPQAEPEAGKPAAPLPKFAKKELDNDPLGGLPEVPNAKKPKAKTAARKK